MSLLILESLCGNGSSFSVIVVLLELDRRFPRVTIEIGMRTYVKENMSF